MQDATLCSRLQGVQYKQSVLDACPGEHATVWLGCCAAYRATRVARCLMKGEIVVFMKEMQHVTVFYRFLSNSALWLHFICIFQPYLYNYFARFLYLFFLLFFFFSLFSISPALLYSLLLPQVKIKPVLCWGASEEGTIALLISTVVLSVQPRIPIIF